MVRLGPSSLREAVEDEAKKEVEDDEVDRDGGTSLWCVVDVDASWLLAETEGKVKTLGP